jgi:hypothetical protein
MYSRVDAVRSAAVASPKARDDKGVFTRQLVSRLTGHVILSDPTCPVSAFYRPSEMIRLGRVAIYLAAGSLPPLYYSTAVLACSFHRSTFTPITKSHRASNISTAPGIRM